MDQYYTIVVVNETSINVMVLLLKISQVFGIFII